MRSEKCSALNVICDVLGNRPGKCKAVVGAGAAADFIENNEGLLRSVIENVCGLGHFNHKGRLASNKLIGSTNTCKDSIDKAYCGLGGWDKRAGLSHEDQKGILSYVGAFA